MSIATLTFEDAPDGTVKVSMDFGKDGGIETSGAHQMAVQALQAAMAAADKPEASA